MATIGKNILENLTTGMYADSKVIYREYVQNACDQIDKAVELGIIDREQAEVFISIKEDERFAEVIVPDDQLSLAIGKAGQNARLAAKLTNWKIDIKSESQFRQILQEQQNQAKNEEVQEDESVNVENEVNDTVENSEEN